MNRSDYIITAFGAVGDGKTPATAAIQAAVEDAAETEGRVVVPPGIFLTAPVFLKSGIEFHLSEGAVLLAVTEEEQYPQVWSRVAGIEMEWPAGVLNIIGQNDVTVSGKGCIDGRGPVWWRKYWGEDRQGGMRRIYERQGLRWAVDYDCKRPRNLLAMNSAGLIVKEITSCRSGFWNLHFCYCEQVRVEDVCIKDNEGPSTDGIDLDSCRHVVIEGCTVSCNDDNICVKSGRDADGLRIARPCEDIVIRNCRLQSGSGLTLGSETSGDIRRVLVENITFDGTDCGFRIKSAKTRGGIVEDIEIRKLRMRQVKTAFSFLLDWNPSYSYCGIPAHWEGDIPRHWHLLLEKVPEETGIPTVRRIRIEDVEAEADQAYELEGYEIKPISQISWNHVKIRAGSLGEMRYVKDINLSDVTISIL